MLVTFSCDAYEDITLFGHIAHKLLLMMGLSGTLPTAILAEEIPMALQQLEHGLKQPSPSDSKKIDDDEDDDVSLDKRALPIIKLLNAAMTSKCDVMITSNLVTNSRPTR